MNRTTEIAADWSSINDIYEAAKARIIDEIPDITMMGGHSSHSYINGTNMYFNYFFDVVGVGPEEETEKYYLPIIGIICEETLRRGGSIVHHHGMGKARAPWVRDEYGSSYYILETLKHAFDPHDIMNKGTIIPVMRGGAGGGASDRARFSAVRIGVGFKVTPDYEALRAADWAAASKATPDGAVRPAHPQLLRRKRPRVGAAPGEALASERRAPRPRRALCRRPRDRSVSHDPSGSRLRTRRARGPGRRAGLRPVARRASSPPTRPAGSAATSCCSAAAVGPVTAGQSLSLSPRSSAGHA